METNKAEYEFNRIERELDEKGEPPVQPPKSGSGNGDKAGGRPNHHHLDAVLVGALLLAGIGLTFWVRKNYHRRRRHNSAQGRSEGLLAC